MISSNLPALLIVVPLLASVAVSMFKKPAIAWLITLITCLILPLISYAILQQTMETGVISYALGKWAPPVGIEFRVDTFNAFILFLVTVIAAVLMPYAAKSVDDEIPYERQSWFYACYLLCVTGLLGIAITGDAFNAFVFLEVSSLATYAMIAMGKDRRALVASYQYLIMGTIGATLYVIGVGFLYSMTGSLNFHDLSQRLPELTTMEPIVAAMAFIIVGLSLKLALFPLHVWLPNAYAYAPSMATIFLAATATKVSVYLLLRYIFTVFGGFDIYELIPLREIFLILSVAAMFGASLVAIYQTNVKRMLAYSSVAQIGYIMLGVALANVEGLSGGLVHIFNHALMKAALFMALGAVMLRVGGVRLDDIAGLGRKMPYTTAAFILAGLSLIGVPGTVGFVSKWYLAAGAIEFGWWWVAFLIMGSSVLAVIYIGRVVEVVWFREPSEKVAAAREAPFSMLLMMWIMTLATVYFGFDTDLTAGVARQAAELLLAGAK